MADELKPVEGYNMLIWEHQDGTVSYTGSFNAAEWEDYTSSRKGEPKLAEGVTVPDPEATNADTNADLNVSAEQPAGNASAEDWEAYARAQGATDADLLDEDGKPLSRNGLRDKFGGEG